MDLIAIGVAAANGGSSGGGSYDDTEIKKDIEQIETDISSLKENAGLDMKLIFTEAPPNLPNTNGGGVINYFQIGNRINNCSLARIMLSASCASDVFDDGFALNNSKVCKPGKGCGLRGIPLLNQFGRSFALSDNGTIEKVGTEEIEMIGVDTVVYVEWLIDESGNPLE